MTKQTKVIKFMLVVLIIIPIALLITGIVQTFVLKNAQQNLLEARKALEYYEQEYTNLEDQYNYMQSDEYKKEQQKHNEYDGDNYGDDGDIDVNIK